MKNFQDYLEVVNEAEKTKKINPMEKLKKLANTDVQFVKDFLVNISDGFKPKLKSVTNYATLLEEMKTGKQPETLVTDVRLWMRTFFEDHSISGPVSFPDGTQEKVKDFKDYAKGLNDGESPMENCLVLLNKLLEKMTPEKIKATIGF